DAGVLRRLREELGRPGVQTVGGADAYGAGDLGHGVPFAVDGESESVASTTASVRVPSRSAKTSAGRTMTGAVAAARIVSRRSARWGPTSTRSGDSVARVLSVPAEVCQSRPAAVAACRSRCATKVLDAPAPHTTRILIDSTSFSVHSGKSLREVPPASLPPLRNTSVRPGGVRGLASWEHHVATAPGPAPADPASRR